MGASTVVGRVFHVHYVQVRFRSRTPLSVVQELMNAGAVRQYLGNLLLLGGDVYGDYRRCAPRAVVLRAQRLVGVVLSYPVAPVNRLLVEGDGLAPGARDHRGVHPPIYRHDVARGIAHIVGGAFYPVAAVDVLDFRYPVAGGIVEVLLRPVGRSGECRGGIFFYPVYLPVGGPVDPQLFGPVRD